MGRYNDIELSDVELTGPRLLLRRWRPDDAARVLAVVAERSMYDFLTLPDPYDEATARDFVTRIGHEGRDEGTGLGCAVVERSTGRVVGAAGLRFATDPDIGYWVAPDARGHGYAVEASRLLADFGFGTLGLPRIAICADVRNLASARTALAAGFAYEGTLRDGAPVAALGRGDMACFGRLADDAGGAIAPTFPPVPDAGLRDGVITLRVLRAGDAPEWLEIQNDEVTLAIGFGESPLSSGEGRRKTSRAGLDLLVGGRAAFAIVDDETRGLAGSISLRQVGPPGLGGIGYAVHPLFRGRGYTARALRLLAPWAFANGFVRLELGAKIENVASQRSALSGGFEPDGVRVGRLRNPDGSYTDEARFALAAPHPAPEVEPPTDPDRDAIAALE